MEYKYSAMLYGCLDGWLFCTVKKNPFDRLDTLAFSGAVFNNCAIDSWLTALAPQEPVAIPAKHRRYVM